MALEFVSVYVCRKAPEVAMAIVCVFVCVQNGIEVSMTIVCVCVCVLTGPRICVCVSVPKGLKIRVPNCTRVLGLLHVSVYVCQMVLVYVCLMALEDCRAIICLCMCAEWP